jgi:G3E family GTPase
MSASDYPDPIPVTILTGYLGAGKTTLLNRILRENHGLRLAVIENEFGEVGVDHELVLQTDEEIFEMNNGCVCCTVRGDLIRILEKLARRRDRFDHILIETTGLADPGPVVQTFFMDPEMGQKFFVDGVITLVDAKHANLHLEDSPEMQEQIAFADRIILNKCDLVSEEEASALESRLRSMNALATIVRSIRAEVPVPELLALGGFNLDHATEIDPHFLDREPPGHDAHEHDHHKHDQGEPHDHALPHYHDHDNSITSVGLEREGDCDGPKLERWLSEITQTKGPDIFRMKGVFAVRGVAHRIIFQGVHMIIEAAEGGPWGARPRRNTLVFIGRNLDRAELTAGFEACLCPR